MKRKDRSMVGSIYEFLQASEDYKKKGVLTAEIAGIMAIYLSGCFIILFFTFQILHLCFGHHQALFSGHFFKAVRRCFMEARP